MPELHCTESLEAALTITGWNKARVKLLARFLMALIVCRTVSLYRLANVLPGEAKVSSQYKRLQRFVAQFDMDFASLARLLVTMLGVAPPFVLALDRTNWKLGKTETNFLVLALVHRGIAFPLFWHVLEKEGRGKAGNSNLCERRSLLLRYLSVFGKESIAYVCADREFGGRDFAAWLLDHRISFVLRLRGNVLVTNAKGEECPVHRLFAHCTTDRACDLGCRKVFGKDGKKGLPLLVSGIRAHDGDFVIVISDRPGSCSPGSCSPGSCSPGSCSPGSCSPGSCSPGSCSGVGEDSLLCRYRKRWGIETLFGCLKRRGFDLEATHLTEGVRLSRLFAVLSVAFCWAYQSGQWLFEQKAWKVRKHGRLPVSLFRAGLDWLQRMLMPLCGKYSPQDFQQAIQILYCT
jgi:hypothetical protein